jgi:hypothetical protein
MDVSENEATASIISRGSGDSIFSETSVSISPLTSLHRTPDLR